MWLAVALSLVWLTTAGAATQVEVEVKSVRLDPDAGSPVVQLVEKAGRGRRLPIWIGPFEAQAIAVELEGVTPPRPLTHDLMREVVEALGGRLERVIVNQLVEGTYHARLELARAGGSKITLDARPSDALALALRLRCPVFVEDAVFAASTDATGEASQVFGLTVQDLTPELAEVLALPGLRGALVTDVDPKSGARKLRRADVVTGVDGESVASAGDLVTQLERRRDGKAMRVALRRQGQPLEVRVRVGTQPLRDR
jgi:uncharacterized protein